MITPAALVTARLRRDAWEASVRAVGADLDQCKARLAHLVEAAGWAREDAMHQVVDEAASGQHGAT